jgi:N-methylhydantoinase A
MKTVGVDIGGTFTDLVGFDGSKLFYSKSLTTPASPTEGVANCLDLAATQPREVDELIHGSTIAINTVLELKGAKTALITTRGFRDVYSIGRSNRMESFNLFFHRPKPLIPRSLTFEVSERMNPRGEITHPLERADVAEIAAQLVALNIQAVAVCFLHSYANAAHELIVNEMLQRLCPGVFVTCSFEILREFREYERTSTTALNAYVGPVVHNYLGRLERYLGEHDFPGNVQIMRSNGGTMSLKAARIQPVAMMESGPVAGVIGAAMLSRVLDIPQCVAFDMGGTTAKSSLISHGEPVVRDGYFIGGQVTGQPMQLPVVDIIEVGAGGGSIAWCDEQGGLHVGPQSAGADPGPACYGRGGDAPTVTDANLMLGRLNAKRFLNGKMALDVATSEAVIRKRVADPLGISVTAAAQGITRIAAATMSLSIRGVSVDRGFDPRDCAMIAFGGGGPLHAVALARQIFIPKIVIPKFPGTFSAVGMLMAAWRQDYVRTLIGDLDEVDETAAKTIFDALAEDGLRQLAEDGIDASRVVQTYGVDLRYRGQEHHISVALTPGLEIFGPVERDAIRELFHAAHEKHFSHYSPGERVQIVNLRLTMTVPRHAGAIEAIMAAPYVAEESRPEERRGIVFEDSVEPIASRILWRPGLAPGMVIEGPAAIEEATSTTLLFPGDVARIGANGDITIDVSLPKL